MSAKDEEGGVWIDGVYVVPGQTVKYVNLEAIMPPLEIHETASNAALRAEIADLRNEVEQLQSRVADLESKRAC